METDREVHVMGTEVRDKHGIGQKRGRCTPTRRTESAYDVETLRDGGVGSHNGVD